MYVISSSWLALVAECMSQILAECNRFASTNAICFIVLLMVISNQFTGFDRGGLLFPHLFLYDRPG